MLSAEKGEKRIVVEIKSFLGASDVKDLEQALGQYVLYQQLLKLIEPDRVLYLAVPDKIYKSVFLEGLGQLFLLDNMLHLLVFDPQGEVITQWIPA